jgi:hypothetical protein
MEGEKHLKIYYPSNATQNSGEQSLKGNQGTIQKEDLCLLATKTKL